MIAPGTTLFYTNGAEKTLKESSSGLVVGPSVVMPKRGELLVAINAKVNKLIDAEVGRTWGKVVIFLTRRVVVTLILLARGGH